MTNNILTQLGTTAIFLWVCFLFLFAFIVKGLSPQIKDPTFLFLSQKKAKKLNQQPTKGKKHLVFLSFVKKEKIIYICIFIYIYIYI